MKKVLVTGAAGFTGQHLMPALERAGYEVVGTCSGSVATDGLLRCDLTQVAQVKDLVMCAQPDAVIHLAAQAFVGSGDGLDYYRTNLFGTLHLLDALLQMPSKPTRILIPSTAHVYGNPFVEVISEDCCPAPVSHYATSKLAMEHMVRTYQDKLPIIISRPFNYTGPGQDAKYLVPKIVKHFKERATAIELGNLDVRRDISDVRDLVSAYLALLSCDAESVTVNVCSGRAIALQEIIRLLEELSGHRLDVRVNPAFVRTNEVKTLRGDNGLLRKLTGWQPVFDFEATLAAMLAS